VCVSCELGLQGQFLPSFLLKYIPNQPDSASKTAFSGGGRKGKLHFKLCKPVGKNVKTILKIDAGGRKWEKKTEVSGFVFTVLGF